MKRNLIILNTDELRRDVDVWRSIADKKLLPLLDGKKYIGDAETLTFKYLKCDGEVYVSADPCGVRQYKGLKGFRIPSEVADDFVDNWNNSEYLFISVEGSEAALAAIAVFTNSTRSCFDDITSRDETLRLDAFGLPPVRATAVSSPDPLLAIYKWLGDNYRELFSINAHQFLNSPHILTSLFEHIGSISSKESISFMDKVRLISDHFRSWMGPRIKSIEKNHHGLWGDVCSERVSFIDGGMSRIIGLPSATPMSIRVGTYTVIPGEDNLETRESWAMGSEIIGDILSDRSLIEDPDFQTDVKRLQEASRYILEPLSLLKSSKERPKPYACLLHGPLQNQFNQYDELRPAYIPGVNPEYLESVEIKREDILNDLENIPSANDGRPIWNSAIPVYVYIMRRISEVDIPLLGVVERAASKSMLAASLDRLVDDQVISSRAKKRMQTEISNLDLDDQAVFGCILESGEYIEPMEITKNLERRANDRWRPLMPQIPKVVGTILKCTDHSFPFRVELNRTFAPEKVHEVMKLVYHTALLLPNYAFPVGLDIVDKYAKIPDWMSKGVSEHLAANIMRHCLQKGDVRTLQQMRTLLSRSPRDFFFRPKA